MLALLVLAGLAGRARAQATISIEEATKRLEEKRHTAPLVGPLPLAAPQPVALAPTTGPATRQAADGTALPVPDDAKANLVLPGGAQILGCGAGPMAATRAVYSLAAGSKRARSLRDAIKSAVYYSPQDHRAWEFQWYTTGLGGADSVGFDLDHGRVTRIGYYYKSFLPAQAAAALRQWGRVDRSARTDADTHTVVVKQADVRLLCHVDRPLPLPVFADVTALGPKPKDAAVLVYEVHPADWYLLYENMTPQIKNAILDGQLVVGMDRAQAKAAMAGRGRSETPSADGNASIVVFYGPGADQTFDVAARFEDGHLVALTHDAAATAP